MAGTVVVQGGTLLCSHSGTWTIVTGSTRLTVGGMGILIAGDEVGLTFSDSCTINVPAAPVSTKLTVGGQAVLLSTAAGATVNSQAGAGTWGVKSAGQTKLTAV